MIEDQILSSLVHNESFARKTLPFLKDEYFSDYNYQVVYGLIAEYVEKYNEIPSKTALLINLEDSEKVSEEVVKEGKKIINGLKETDVKEEWLLDKTEEFCQDKAIYNAIKQSIGILDGNDKKHDKGAIPELLKEALGVSFDSNIGHEYLENAAERFEYYNKREHKIPLGIEMFDKITKGGVSRKALICFLAQTGVGKTLAMCCFAANNLMAGLNVLYITNEMAEEEIGKRIDANLMDITLDELEGLPEKTYKKKIEAIKSKTTGEIVIKEYPTSTAGANHFRHCLNELNLKKNFVPDIIYIDYLNICVSSRIKNFGNTNSYTYIKAIAEELRGLGVEFEVPVITASQVNREGFNNSDIDMTNTSESIGLPATVDFLGALISNDELESLGKLMFKQLKNRWGDTNTHKKFCVGIDRSKMKIYDLDSPTDGLVSDVMPQSSEVKQRSLSMDGFT